MATDVPTIITAQQAAANNYITQAQAFIDQVANLANTEFSVNVPTALNFGMADITDDALDKINNQKPVRPTFSDIDVLAPTAPVVAFDTIDQTILDAVKAKLLTDLSDGGYGIEPTDEAALWQRERDRETQQALADEEEVTRQFAQGGFSMPQGAMFDALAKAQQRASDKISSVNRDIALRRSELYVQNRQFAIQQGQSVEGVLISLHRAVTEQVMATTAIYNSQISKYRADIESGLETIRANVSIYLADVQAFNAAISAISEAYKLKSQEQQLNNMWNVEVVKTRLEEARVKLQGQVSAAGVRNSAAQFGSQYYLGVIMAALGSINTLAAQTLAQ